MSTAQAVRSSELAQIHIAKKDLGLDDDTYRAMLFTLGRVRSAKDLDWAGRKKVLDHLKACGWKKKPPTKAGGRKLDDAPQAKMIRGLWLELHGAGLVRDPSEAALASFVKRQIGVDALQFCSGAQLARLIEALKQWLKR
jgi:phage gp16-like protein